MIILSYGSAALPSAGSLAFSPQIYLLMGSGLCNVDQMLQLCMFDVVMRATAETVCLLGLYRVNTGIARRFGCGGAYQYVRP